MNLKVISVCLIACLCAGSAQAEHRVQKYAPGADMTFTNARERVMCKSLDSASTMSSAIRKKFDAITAIDLLWKPLYDNEAGDAHLRPEIMEAVPKGILSVITSDCVRATSPVTLVKAHSYDVIDDENELVLVEFTDSDKDTFYTWLLNIEIVDSSHDEEETTSDTSWCEPFCF